MSKIRRLTRSGAGCRVSQANGAAIHSKLPGLWHYELVSGILEKKGSNVQAQLWVPGRSRVHGRPYISFCPITLRHYSFRY